MATARLKMIKAIGLGSVLLGGVWTYQRLTQINSILGTEIIEEA